MGVSITFGKIQTVYKVGKQHPTLGAGWRTDFENVPKHKPAWLPAGWVQGPRILVIVASPEYVGHEMTTTISVAWFNTAQNALWVVDDASFRTPAMGYTADEDEGESAESADACDFVCGALFQLNDPRLIAWLELDDIDLTKVV